MNVPQICLRCEKTLLNGTQRMECQACGAHWPADHDIPSYDSAKYFGEVTQEKMQELIALAEKGHWLTAVRTMFKDSNPELYDYVADLNRASWIPILPIGPHSTVLDVNSGLGALTHALALNYEQVVSVEPVAEMVRFAKIRLDQEGLKNVDFIHSTLDVLPFYKESFDLIVLNGILEWVGEWRGRGTPKEAQIEVLKHLRRLLKPHGVLLIGTENRIGYTSFPGRMDPPGVGFTSLMPRRLASLYLRLKKPGFYRTLMDPTKGCRTHTYSRRGYFKLLRQAGYPLADLWWAPNGYNSPHTMLRASNRAEVKAYCDQERRYKDRIHGYALRRQLRHWAVVDTGLIQMMFPDVIMIAHPAASQTEKQLDGGVPLLAALDKHLSTQPESSGKGPGVSDRYYADFLMTHPYKNKAVIKLFSTGGEPHAVVKVANVRLPGAAVVERSYQKLQRLYSSFQGGDPFLAGSIPTPMGVVRVGSLLATMERSARGPGLVDLVMDRQYFQNRDRVRRHLELITSWLIASKPKLEALRSDSLFDAIPSEWLVPPDGENAAGRGSVPESFRGAQHGDFYTENVFVDERDQNIFVIDWDSCGTGYPPLFDWFCFVTSLYYTHERICDLPKGQTAEFMSFRQTYFEAGWFSDLIVSLSHRLCDRLGLDSARLLDYFLQYIVVRYRQFVSPSELQEKNYWGPQIKDLYMEYYEYLIKNRKQCCFWNASPSMVRIGQQAGKA